MRSDEDVARWVNTQNALTQDYLATLPGREVFRERLAVLLNHEQSTPPIKRGGRYFFTKRSGRDNQHMLLVRDDVDGEDRIVIDPNRWSEDSSDALGEWAASDDGRLVAYGVQIGGTDWRTIRVLDVDTGKVLDDEVNWARFSESFLDENASFIEKGGTERMPAYSSRPRRLEYIDDRSDERRRGEHVPPIRLCQAVIRFTSAWIR